MKKGLLAALTTVLLLGMTGLAQAHTSGNKYAAMSFRETVDANGGFAVTAKVWNYTDTTKRVKVVVEVVVSQYLPSSYTSIDRVATKSTVLRIPAFGTNRKRMFGNLTTSGWSFGADNYIYSDVLHTHKA